MSISRPDLSRLTGRRKNYLND